MTKKSARNGCAAEMPIPLKKRLSAALRQNGMF